jgi:hypothetical protein
LCRLKQHLPAPPKSKKDWKNDSTAFLFEEKFLANSKNSLTQQQQQWQEILY